MKFLIQLLNNKLIRYFLRPWLYQYYKHIVENDLKKMVCFEKVKISKNNSSKKIFYFRTDLWMINDKASGAIAHTKGVIEALENFGYGVNAYFTYPLNANIKRSVCVSMIPPSLILKSYSELREIEYNHRFIKMLSTELNRTVPQFIYHRYGLNNYAGAYLANKFKIPFILEYNGSEIWMSKNWNRPLRYENLTEKIEMANFKAADIIIANAKSLQKELVRRGIEKEKILIVPNGVEINRFNPSISGLKIRSSLGFSREHSIVTFIGTFGPWHGAEVLAKCIKYAIKENQNLRFVFIGNGGKINEVKRILKEDSVNDFAYFTGVIPPDEAPEYIAASDILVAPQIENPDGSEFFGSPTKLFEYMAMGKAIIASNLAQMGEILRHGKTALLFEPGNANSLAKNILELAVDVEKRVVLGSNARKEVVNNYTWEKHVSLILDRLKV